MTSANLAFTLVGASALVPCKTPACPRRAKVAASRSSRGFGAASAAILNK